MFVILLVILFLLLTDASEDYFDVPILRNPFE